MRSKTFSHMFKNKQKKTVCSYRQEVFEQVTTNFQIDLIRDLYFTGYRWNIRFRDLITLRTNIKFSFAQVCNSETIWFHRALSSFGTISNGGNVHLSEGEESNKMSCAAKIAASSSFFRDKDFSVVIILKSVVVAFRVGEIVL
uniref:Uncharacterized protein n=1 Tax=Glossina pallidipes TaxID=7398 RepID=A0A1A9ZS66_GLOPL